MSSLPYIIQISEPVQTIHFSNQPVNIDLQLDNHNDLNNLRNFHTTPYLVESIHSIESGKVPKETLNNDDNCIYQIVYPQELNLVPAYKLIKRGRPKKKKSEEVKKEILITKDKFMSDPPKTARTRSGRLVKLPKHIEKDFKKIELSNDEQELQLTDFKRFEEKENNKVEFPQLNTKKRAISSQYKCPKCQKAYLGKNKMLQHLQKNPDHGPLPESHEQFNFDVWNYLFDITQKAKPGQRGAKFCEELSNLLHNVQLLKSALFKTVTDNKNCVHIDKVLGSAIGLAPGKYKFDENELYKDVTVLKLITNTEFFKPNKATIEILKKENNTNEILESADKTVKENKLGENLLLDNDIIQDNDNKMEEDVSKQEDSLYFSDKNNSLTEKAETATTETYDKKMSENNHITLSSDLLADNLLLHSIPNNRKLVDELMLSNETGSALLENSTSCDEVMNVDQFVNERFKKIIEPDIDLGGNSLNLDLPTLGFYPFDST